MKKVITIIATAFIAISASAQSEVGSLTWQPNAGVTYTTATSELGEWADGAVSITNVNSTNEKGSGFIRFI